MQYFITVKALDIVLFIVYDFLYTKLKHTIYYRKALSNNCLYNFFMINHHICEKYFSARP